MLLLIQLKEGALDVKLEGVCKELHIRLLLAINFYKMPASNAQIAS